MRRITAIALLPAAALSLAACGGSSQGVTATTDPAATLSPSSGGGTDGSGSGDGTGGATATSSAAVEMGDEMFGTAADVGGPYGELRDGPWGVGVAGEVDFRVTGPNSLELVNIGVTEGWQLREQEVESDKIDIEYHRGPVEYRFEVEIDDGLLELEIDQDIDRTSSGTFAVGEAATVDITAEVGALTLGDVMLADGWGETSREVDNDDIELDFRRQTDGFFELWELNADRGRDSLDVEVHYEIEGRFTG
ncbi:MAG: hypothetical protein WCA30_17980 [Dermatophilaceae bacterium]